jgi:hypothetical protein
MLMLAKVSSRGHYVKQLSVIHFKPRLARFQLAGRIELMLHGESIAKVELVAERKLAPQLSVALKGGVIPGFFQMSEAHT